MFSCITNPFLDFLVTTAAYLFFYQQFSLFSLTLKLESLAETLVINVRKKIREKEMSSSCSQDIWDPEHDWILQFEKLLKSSNDCQGICQQL